MRAARRAEVEECAESRQGNFAQIMVGGRGQGRVDLLFRGAGGFE